MSPRTGTSFQGRPDGLRCSRSHPSSTGGSSTFGRTCGGAPRSELPTMARPAMAADPFRRERARRSPVWRSNNTNMRRVACNAAATLALESDYTLSNGMVDYYKLLHIDDDASLSQIKKAYRQLAKQCHPDFLGDELGTPVCILLNEAYEVLCNPLARDLYDVRLQQALDDESDGFTGEPLSRWMPDRDPSMAQNEDPAESRAVFVDEAVCIGCKMCMWCASSTFAAEPEFGRSRAVAQWADEEDDIQAAIDSCPVDCIHWVEREQLPALEYVMQHRMGRTSVGIMMSAGQGGANYDVFKAAELFMKERKQKEERRATVSQQWSPAQQEMRRKAAAHVLKQHLGWLSELGAMFVSDEPMMSPGMRVNEGGCSGEKVGQRKRSRTPSGGVGGIGYSAGAVVGLVPPERALVPCAKRPSDV